MSDNPVEKYYKDKKQRYLNDMRDAASSMTTGTPFDWEDAEALIEDANLDSPKPDASGDA